MMMKKKVKIVPKLTEWTSLLVSLLLEGFSAILDQLGFSLASMIMAFMGLLLAITDLTLKAQEKRLIWVVGSSFLPCFRRNFSSNGKRFDSLVAYFGVACAAWQCLFSTIGYLYAHQNLNNPIKMCLLPFVFVSCVVITQFIRSTVPSDKKSQATGARTAEEADETEVVKQSTPPLHHSFHFPPDRQRFNKKQQAVISVGEESSNNALKIAVGVSGSRMTFVGVEGAFLGEQEKGQIEVIGNEFDATVVTSLIRENVGFAELISVTIVGEDVKKAMVWRNGAHVPNNVFDQFSHHNKDCWQNEAFRTWPPGRRTGEKKRSRSSKVRGRDSTGLKPPEM